MQTDHISDVEKEKVARRTPDELWVALDQSEEAEDMCECEDLIRDSVPGERWGDYGIE